MKKFLLFTSLIFSNILVQASVIRADDFDKYFQILPKPQKIEFSPGKSFAFHNLRYVHLQGLEKRPVLNSPLKELQTANKMEKGVLSLELSKDIDLPSSPEGYILEIGTEQVLIRARGEAGIFYGCQTLLQLIEDSRENRVNIPACKITDYPELDYRAVHLDLKHHLDSVSYYLNLIDRLARVKVNALIIEFEDKLQYRAPLVGASNAISIDEFAAISRYAKDRHIEISPLIQGLGHAGYILKHEKYKHLRDDPESDWAFDPLKPETYDLQFSLYEDAIEATPYGKYLHVGGDEVGELGKSELARKSGKKPFELQMLWLNKVTEFARQHNRIPIFWDDMLFKLSGLYKTTYRTDIPPTEVEKVWTENQDRLNEIIKLLPKDCVYMRWNYWDPAIPGNKKAIDWYKEHNLKVMAATSATNDPVRPMFPRANSNIKTIRLFSQIASEKKMDGILCTVWDNTSPHLETLWRSFYSFALFSWNYENITDEEFNSMFRHRFYAAALSDPSFAFQNELEQSMEFWETALVDKGHRYVYPKEIGLIELPDRKKQGAWAEKYKEKVSNAGSELVRYARIKEKIETAQKLAHRNQYSLALMAQINELQIYPSKLLILLNDYDKIGSVAEEIVVRERIQKYVDSFQKIRAGYEEVFSKTRILNNPSDYKLDQSEHLANGTINSDWMYVFELTMNKELTSWLRFD